MDWITARVAIGNYLEATDIRGLRMAGIRSALSLDGTLDENDAELLGLAEVVSIPLMDGPGNDQEQFLAAVASVARLAKTQAPVFVHCQAGRSRSIAVVAGYLVMTHQMDPKAALEAVISKRSACVAQGLIDRLHHI